MVKTYNPFLNSCLWFFVFVAILLYLDPKCYATVHSNELTSYWASKPNADVSPNSLAELRQIGLRDPNQCVVYFNSTTFQTHAINSMLLFETETNQLSVDTLVRLVELCGRTTNTLLQKSAIELMISYVDNKPVIDFLSMRVPVSLQVETSNYVLDTLGQAIDRKRVKTGDAKNVIQGILNIRLIQAGGGMSCNGVDSASDLIYAIQKWSIYEDKRIAKSCADIFLKRMQGPLHLLSKSEFEPVLIYLTTQSKADPDHISLTLSRYCCSDTNLASAILWKLNESKDKSAVAKKTLELFSTQCGKNKGILQGIQSGAVKKEDAFDTAITEYRASRRLR